MWAIFWDNIRDSETVCSEVLRGKEIKYVITALGNIAYEKSYISFWFKYSLQSKLPKASSFLTVKAEFRKNKRSSIPHTILGTVLWWPVSKHCSKKGLSLLRIMCFKTVCCQHNTLLFGQWSSHTCFAYLDCQLGQLSLKNRFFFLVHVGFLLVFVISLSPFCTLQRLHLHGSSPILLLG